MEGGDAAWAQVRFHTPPGPSRPAGTQNASAGDMGLQKTQSQGNNPGTEKKERWDPMHISLRCRLDSARDRFVIEFEPSPGAVVSSKPIQIEGMKEPAQLELDADGYIVSLSIPGLSKGLAAIAGEKPGKPAR